MFFFKSSCLREITKIHQHPLLLHVKPWTFELLPEPFGKCCFLRTLYGWTWLRNCVFWDCVFWEMLFPFHACCPRWTWLRNLLPWSDTARHDGWEGLLDLGWHCCMYPIVTSKHCVCKYYIYISYSFWLDMYIYIHINIVEVSPTIFFRLCARRLLMFGWIQHLGRFWE